MAKLIFNLRIKSKLSKINFMKTITYKLYAQSLSSIFHKCSTYAYNKSKTNKGNQTHTHTTKQTQQHTHKSKTNKGNQKNTHTKHTTQRQQQTDTRSRL